MIQNKWRKTKYLLRSYHMSAAGMESFVSRERRSSPHLRDLVGSGGRRMIADGHERAKGSGGHCWSENENER
jgi:hypothetical protein